MQVKRIDKCSTRQRIFLNCRKNRGSVVLMEDDESFTFPYGVFLPLSLRWEVYMHLRSDNGASWRSYLGKYNLGDKDLTNIVLTWGRKNPTVRFFADSPIVYHKYKGVSLLIPQSHYFISQECDGEIIGINTSSIIPFPADKALDNLIKKIENQEIELYGEQGHLKIYRVPANDVEKGWDDDYQVYKTTKFLNHQFIGGELLAKERDGYTLYALVKFPWRGWIVSPDHPDNIDIYASGPRYFVLAHPRPNYD